MFRATILLFLVFSGTVIAQDSTRSAIQQRRQNIAGAFGQFASSQQAAQAATFALLARRNAARRQQVMEEYRTRPPLDDYSRADQKYLQEVIYKEIEKRNIGMDATLASRMMEYESARSAWQDKKQKIDDAYKEATRVFQPAASLRKVGDVAQLNERGIRVDQVASKTAFVNLQYHWWVEGSSTAKLSEGVYINTAGLIFEVTGEKRFDIIAARLGIETNAQSPRTILEVKVRTGGIARPQRAEYPPEPVMPLRSDVADDARMFDIGGREIICTYLDKLRVKNRKYDVFFAVLAQEEYKLAWVPFDVLSKEDRRWIGLEEQRRKREQSASDRDRQPDR